MDLADIRSNQYYQTDPLTYHVQRCGGCAFLFVNPTPTTEFLQQHYNKNFDHDALLMPRRRNLDQKLIQKVLALGGFDKRAPEEVSFYEIGIGTGRFAGHVHDVGLNVRGCEFSQTVGARAHPFPVDVGEFQSFGFDRQFDIVSSNHVLEHLNNPVGLIQAVHKSLKEEGLLLIRVPNQNASYFRLASLLLGPHKWDTYLPVPDHLMAFSREGLEALFVRNGFTVVESGTLPFVNNEGNVLVSYIALTAKAFVLRVLPLFGKKVTSSSEVTKGSDDSFNWVGRLALRLNQVLRPVDTLFMAILWPLFKRFGLGEDLYCIGKKNAP